MDDVTAERWLPIPGTDGCYQVSDYGRVWSKPRHGTRGGIMAGSVDPDGYRQVLFHCYGKVSGHKIHGLVALAFIGPRPDGQEVRHLDGDQKNNNLTNLAYGTHRLNTQERVLHGHHYQSNKTHCAHGHPFDGTNTRIRKDGSRACRACARERDRRRREAQAQPALVAA